MSKERLHPNRGLVSFFVAAAVGIIIAGAMIHPASAQTPQPGGMFPTSDFLTPPPTVYPPAPADQGQQVYYYYCMTCHGDRAQGLTQEWRNRIGPQDSNCWASHCHASNRTGSNFSFPRNVPALVGPGVLDGFSNALNLHDFIRVRMPYQAPGSLSEAEYWQLTAYLLRINGVDPGRQPLDAARAKVIRFSVPATPAPAPGSPISRIWDWLAGGLAVLLLAGFILFIRRKNIG